MEGEKFRTSGRIITSNWHSTETTLIKTTDVILKAIDNKKLTAVVLLDLSKAFDSLDHDILISKRNDVGLSFEALRPVLDVELFMCRT